MLLCVLTFRNITSISERHTKAAWTGRCLTRAAITLLTALQCALNRICAEGIRNTLARHNRLAVATRSAIKALGLPLFASSPANTLTSIRLPTEIDGKAFINLMRDTYGITYAGGQSQLSGKNRPDCTSRLDE